MARSFGAANVRLIDRHPETLRRFRFARLARAQDPVAAFEAMVGQVGAMAGDGEPLAPLVDESLVRLVRKPRVRSPLVRWVRGTLRVRSRLQEAGLLHRARSSAALNTLRWADVVVWNPAGELYPTGAPDEVMLILLMVRLAQRLGKRVAIINHSLENADPVLDRLVSHVYRNADFVSVRERGSYDRGLELGVPAGKLHEVPDLAFLLAEPGFAPETALPAADPLPPGSIALAINGQEAHRGGEGWRELVEGLVALGRPIVFLSNSMVHDLPFARAMAKEAPVIVRPDQPTFAEMVRLYRGAEVVVSSRLHASILALCAGTPVVSVEPQIFKLTAIFRQLGYPLRTHRMEEPGWAAGALADVRRVLDERAAIVAATEAPLARQVAAIETAYAGLVAMARA
jgi:polysaccharide pyruvyl transferase WcaK-like protein